MIDISIIVPVYNVERYLEKCITSILNQSFSNFELILVDDESKDGSGGICDKYAENDSRVRVIHKQNAGVSSARNTGLDSARGRYIMFCDSDDYVSPYWCETMKRAIEQYPGELICHGIKNVSEDALIEESTDVCVCKFERLSYYEMYCAGLSGACWNKIYEKHIIDQNCLRFDENVVVGEDVIFETAYAKFCKGCVCVSDELYYYVKREGSALTRYYYDRLSMRMVTFWHRIPLVSAQEMAMFCDGYLYQFMQLLDNIFDKRNAMPFLAKMRYNHTAFNAKPFRFCVEHSSGEKESRIIMQALKSGNYYYYFGLIKVLNIWNYIRGGRN